MTENVPASKPNHVRGEAEVIRSKVGEDRLDSDNKAGRIIDLDQAGTTAWFYWSPSPGVRCYTYGKETNPVQQIKPRTSSPMDTPT